MNDIDKNTTNICRRSVWEKDESQLQPECFSPQQEQDGAAFRIHQLGPIEELFPCQNHTCNTNSFIVSAALSVEDWMKQVVVAVANDTDNLVLRMCLSTSSGYIHLFHSHNPIQCTDIYELQFANASVCESFLFLHSMTGRDITSALNMNGKQKHLVQLSHKTIPKILDVFTALRNTHYDFAWNGEYFF